MIEGSRFCKSEPVTPQGMAGVLIGIPAGIIFWVVTGICVAKICEKAFHIDIDHPFVMIAGMLVPPMMVGLVILLLS
jgi:hypothetical protein